MKTIFRRNVAKIAALALICALLAVTTLSATEIKVVTSGAFTAAYLELVPEYERTTHNKLATEFGPSMGTTHNAIPIRLDRGETIDVVNFCPVMSRLLSECRRLWNPKRCPDFKTTPALIAAGRR